MANISSGNGDPFSSTYTIYAGMGKKVQMTKFQKLKNSCCSDVELGCLHKVVGEGQL